MLASDSLISVVFVTGRGDIPSTVLAMKDGAVDFLTKPIDEDAAVPWARYQRLTPREQELLGLLARGLLNKQAARILGITEYTVQVHRRRIMRR